MKRLRILLADDHTILLQGLRDLLTPEFDVVGAVGDGRALLAAAEELQPDALVSDISMPLLNGIDAARRLRDLCPRCKIVVLTMHNDAGLMREAFRVGVAGYVLKTCAVQDLATAIREAMRGRMYVSPALKQVPGSPLADDRAGRGKKTGDLTPRQREVLQLAAEGKSLKEIAMVLGVAVKTAEFHKYRLMQILGVRTTAELVQYALKHRVVS
jgi:DNA-binding NarL/FixJ family response regulator